MSFILFYAFLMANGALVQGSQVFDDKAACEAAQQAQVDRWAPNSKSPDTQAFCVAKGTDTTPAPTADATPPRASGTIAAKAPTAIK